MFHFSSKNEVSELKIQFKDASTFTLENYFIVIHKVNCDIDEVGVVVCKEISKREGRIKSTFGQAAG